MSEWQPIETAPKDGREVITFGNRGVCAFIDVWCNDPHFKGWMSEYISGYKKPTHWKPLPEPPR